MLTTRSRPCAGTSDGAASNPLRDGLSADRITNPCSAFFSVRAAISSSACCFRRSIRCVSAERCPPDFALVGFARRRYDDDEISRILPPAARCCSCRPTRSRRARSGTISRAAFRYITADFNDTRHFVRPQEAARSRTTESSARREIISSTSRRRRRFSRRSSSISRAPVSIRDETGWTRIIVEKPFGTDLASARALQAAIEARLSGERDLPHRPLSRQGAGSGHHRAALCQHDLRADLEPQLRRRRADHFGRVARRRGTRRLLRPRRRAARHDPESRHQSARPRRDGAADQLGRRRHPQREV